MEFLNDPIIVDQLPKAEEVTLKPIDRMYLTVLRIEWLISSLSGFLVVFLLIFFFRSLHNLFWIITIPSGWLILCGLFYLLQTKSFARKAFAVRQHDLIYRTGWIVQSIRTCPFNRIQHSSVSTGPLERKFGLAKLVLYSAGADDADVHIPGLKESEAYSLKEWVTKKITNEPPTGE